jgi:hypothetical protein
MVMNYNRYLLIITVGRVVLWSSCLLFFFKDLTSTFMTHEKKRRQLLTQIKIQSLTAVLGVIFMMMIVDSVMPQWTSKVIVIAPPPNSTSVSSVADNGTTSPHLDGCAVVNRDPCEAVYLLTRHKMLLLAAYALCDYIASTIATTIFSKKPSFRVLGKQMKLCLVVTVILWVWFACIVSTASMYSDPSVNYIVKAFILGWVFPFLKVVVVYCSKIGAVAINTALKLGPEQSNTNVTQWVTSIERSLVVCSSLSLSTHSKKCLLFYFFCGLSYYLYRWDAPRCV